MTALVYYSHDWSVQCKALADSLSYGLRIRDTNIYTIEHRITAQNIFLAHIPSAVLSRIS